VNIILAGHMGRWAIGGGAWYHMQYLRGLIELGHEVFYLEDCGRESWVYNWDSGEMTNELKYPASYIQNCLEPLGLGGKWIYRAQDHSEGMATGEFLDVCSEADLLIVHGVPLDDWRPEYSRPRRRIFVDIDPGFTQISLANGDAALTNTVARCESLFTFGQSIFAGDSGIPDCGRRWLTTVPPVSLTDWPYVIETAAPVHFTCVMQWRGFRDVIHEGVLYGQKDREFPKFLDLPRLTSQRFCLALTGQPQTDLSEHGWEVVPGIVPSRTPWSYREFIQRSRAEFGVAKHGYVLMQGGWFSDRSVCYLASGRPVLLQDTGLDRWLPTGEGVVTFRSVREALDGIDRINSDYERHRRSARALAEGYFATERVLPRLLDEAMS
jgi:hypothetical protein